MRIPAKSIFALLIAALTFSTLTAVPASAAPSTPNRDANHLMLWDVIRDGDENGVVHVVPDLPAYAFTYYTLKRSFVQTLTTSDTMMIRMDVSGAIQMESAPQWMWEGQTNSNLPPQGASIKAPSVAGTGNSRHYINMVIQPDSTGVVTMTPKLYKNGVLLTGAVTDYFESLKPRVYQQIRTSSYTVTSEDIFANSRTSACADVSQISAGQVLTPSLTLKRNGGSVTGSTQNISNLLGVGPWTSMNGSNGGTTLIVPNPKPEFYLAQLARGVKINDASSNVVTGDVLTADAAIVNSSATSVIGECPGASTIGLTQSYSGLSYNRVPLNVNLTYTMKYRCEFTDSVSGKTTYSMMIGNPDSWGMSDCSTEGLQVGHTYHTVAMMLIFSSIGRGVYDDYRYMTYGMPLNYEEADITIAREDATEPTIPGTTGPGALRWQSFDNATGTQTNFLGRGNNQSLELDTANDGFDGRLATSRISNDTIRIEHWGPNGRVKFGTADYVDFTDPISSDDIRTQDYGSSIGWYGNRDKWFFVQTDNNDMVITTGSYDDTNTSTFRVTLNQSDLACIDVMGPDSFVSDFWSQKYDAFSAPGEFPYIHLMCAASIEGSPEWMRNAFDGYAIARVTGISGGYGTLDGVANFTPNDGKKIAVGSSDYWMRGATDVAVNPKKDLSASDIAIVAVHADWDTVGNIGVNYFFQPVAPDTVSITLVKVDGSIVQVAKENSLNSYGNMVHFSVAFDGDGKIRLIWTTTASSGVGEHTYRLIDISPTGVPTLNKTFTLDNIDAFEVEPKVYWFGNANSYPNPDNVDVSQLVLANGVGDSEKLYMARYAPGVGVAYTVLNITTGNAWSGEAALSDAFRFYPYVSATSGLFDFDDSGNMFYSRKYKESTYSVLRWGTGIDPAAGPVITSPNEFEISVGSKTVETATSTATNGTWSITGGKDSSLFKINETTGLLEFKNLPAEGDYEVEITITEDGKTSSQTITVHVIDDSLPEFDLAESVNVEIGTSGIIVTPANPTKSGTYTLGGSDAGLFEIDPDTGAVTLVDPNQALGDYTISITLTDNNGNQVTHSTVIHVVEHIEVGLPSPASRKNIKGNKTKVEWTAAENAIQYKVKLANKVLCTTVNTSCTFKKQYAANKKIYVYAYASNGDEKRALAEFQDSTPVTGKKVKLGMVNFALDSLFIDLTAVRKLNKIVKAIKKAGYKKIFVYGHTDNQGPAPHDISLSYRRARQVWMYLDKRLDNVKFVYKGFSRHEPAKPNTTEANKAFNRRVEVWAR